MHPSTPSGGPRDRYLDKLVLVKAEIDRLVDAINSTIERMCDGALVDELQRTADRLGRLRADTDALDAIVNECLCEVEDALPRRLLAKADFIIVQVKGSDRPDPQAA